MDGGRVMPARYSAIFIQLPGYGDSEVWSAEIFRGTARARVSPTMEKSDCIDWVQSWVDTDTPGGTKTAKPTPFRAEFRPITTDLITARAASIANAGGAR